MTAFVAMVLGIAICAAVGCVLITLEMAWAAFASWWLARHRPQARRTAQGGSVDSAVLAQIGLVALWLAIVSIGVWLDPLGGIIGAVLGTLIGSASVIRTQIRRWLRRRRLWLIMREAVDDEKIWRELRRDHEIAQRVRRCAL